MTDQEHATAVSAAADALNKALADAFGAGLQAQVNVSETPTFGILSGARVTSIYVRPSLTRPVLT